RAIHPFRMLSLLVVAAFSRHPAAITRFGGRCLFRIFAYGFHGLSFALLVWVFWFRNRVGVCELRMGWVRPVFRHRKYKAPADSKLFENSLFARFFTAGSRLVLLEDASVR